MQHLECKGHNRPIRMMKFNREGDFLFSCSDDATVCVWKILPSPTLLGKIKCKSAIKSMDVDYLTKYVITAEAARGVGIYNALGGEVLGSITLGGQQKFIQFSYGAKEFLVLSEDKGETILRIYNTAECLKSSQAQPIQIIPLEEATQAHWGPLNESIYLSMASGMVIIINPKTSDIINSRSIHKKGIYSLTFSEDQCLLFSCGIDSNVCLLDLNTLEIIKKYNHHNFPARCVCVSPLYKPNALSGITTPKYHILIGGGQDEKDVTQLAGKGGFEIRLWNFITGQEIGEISGHFGTVHSLVWTPDGHLAASCGEDGTLRMYKCKEDYFIKY